MKTRIITARGVRTALARDFGVTVRMVHNALNMISNSEKAKTIRAAALHRGGALYDERPTERLTENQLKPIN